MALDFLNTKGWLINIYSRYPLTTGIYMGLQIKTI